MHSNGNSSCNLWLKIFLYFVIKQMAFFPIRIQYKAKFIPTFFAIFLHKLFLIVNTERLLSKPPDFDRHTHHYVLC